MNVSVAPNSIHIAFTKIVPTDDCFNSFDHYVEEFQDILHDKFPTVYPCIRWVGKEDCAIASNEFAYFGVSERNGNVSMWVAPKEIKPILKPLRDNWLKMIGKKFSDAAAKSFKNL